MKKNISRIIKIFLVPPVLSVLSFAFLGAKQATLITLNQSFDIIKQLEACQESPHPDKAKILSDIGIVTGQVSGIQSDIIALQLKQQQIKDTTDLGLIPSLYTQVLSAVTPEITQSLVFAAQQETSQKQITLTNYQNILDACIAAKLIPPPPAP